MCEAAVATACMVVSIDWQCPPCHTLCFPSGFEKYFSIVVLSRLFPTEDGSNDSVLGRASRCLSSMPDAGGMRCYRRLSKMQDPYEPNCTADTVEPHDDTLLWPTDFRSSQSLPNLYQKGMAVTFLRLRYRLLNLQERSSTVQQ